MCIFFSFLPPVFPPSLLCCVAVWLSLPFSYLPCSLYVYFFSSKNFFLYLFWNFLQYAHIICKWGHSLSSFPRVNSFSCLTALPAVSLLIFQSSIILVCTPQFTRFSNQFTRLLVMTFWSFAAFILWEIADFHGQCLSWDSFLERANSSPLADTPNDPTSPSAHHHHQVLTLWVTISLPSSFRRLGSPT